MKVGLSRVPSFWVLIIRILLFRVIKLGYLTVFGVLILRILLFRVPYFGVPLLFGSL